jgi:hypothetical protein
MSRLDDVVIRAFGKAADPVGVRAATADDDHRQRRVVAAGCSLRGADLSEDVEPRRVRQAQVQQEEVPLSLGY